MNFQSSGKFDYIIIGSGFGGSVSALRLAEKGYKVLVIEKGKWYKPKDFPKTNWNLKKWLWLPALRFFGILKLTIFRHVSILSGVGVGGGSLVYANTLPVPKTTFFKTGSWSALADWENELRPFYQKASEMLGAARNPQMCAGDLTLRDLAGKIGREEHFEAPKVGVFFGEPDKTVEDPYFDGNGPKRSGCTFCGSCMTGCRVGAKNSLDKNYLYLAQKHGAKIIAENEVIDIKPIGARNGSEGYRIMVRNSTRLIKMKNTFDAKGVIFSGGVLGTVPLLIKLKKTSLTDLSDRVGEDLRINNETLVSVTTPDFQNDYSKGIAIGSLLHTDTNSHLEIVRYGKGSGFWKLTHMPHMTGKSFITRFAKMMFAYIRSPITYMKVYWNGDWSTRTNILLFMQTVDSTLKLRPGLFRNVNTSVSSGNKPTADIPESTELTKLFSGLTNGKPMAFFQQTLFGKASTAHILGGAVMGESDENGVIDKNNRVFGYENMYVVDGSMISANPGVNPSLTITAIAERAMDLIPENKGNGQ